MHWLNTMRVRFPNIIFTMIQPTVDYGKNVAVFKVPLNVNKKMIRNYIEQVYQVKVKEVRTMVYQGKTKRSITGLPIKKPDWKKALVFLRDQQWRFPTLDEQSKMVQTAPVQPSK